MSARSAEISVLDHDGDGRRLIAAALKTARSRLRWHGIWPATLKGATAGSFLAALWIALVRFTLLDLPTWPALTIYCVGVLAGLLASLRSPVTSARAARFLDRSLQMDERVSTYLELRRAAHHGSRTAPSSLMLTGMMSDASALIEERLQLLPPPTRWAPGRRGLVLLVASLATLGAAMVVPSPMDAVRAEQAALKRSLTTRLGELEALRLQILEDPAIAGNDKRKLDAELSALMERLQTPGLTRSDLVAALADSQERISGLIQTPASEFDPLLRAAELIWEQARDQSIGSPYWDPAAEEQNTGLARGAYASGFNSTNFPRFTPEEETAIALTLENAALQTGDRRPDFTQNIVEASAAIRARQGLEASNLLRQLEQRFRAADREQKTASAYEQTLAKLDESKYDVARAGTNTQKRPQVGFRRRTAPTPTSRTAAEATDPSGGSDAATPRGSQGLPPGSGASEPGQPSSGSPAAGPQGTPASAGPEGLPGPPQQGPNNSTGSQSDGSGAANDGDASGGQPVQRDAGEGGAQADGQGTLQGQVSAPVTGSSGAISRVPNPEGSGSAQGGSDAASGPTDEVSVPALESGAESVNSGAEGPSDDTSAGAGTGAESVGEQTDGQGKGRGGLTTVKTPYKEVVGEYAERATEALDRAYIPADAKQYVRDYFTVLGK